MCIIRFPAQVTPRIGGIVEMAYAGGVAVAAAAHTSSYRVKFRKSEFMDLVQMAQPSVIYHVRRMHFFAHDGFVMYTFECESEDFSIKVMHAIEFSNIQWSE
jgi:hypothetical protein